MTYKAAVFDMDGVIIDSEPIHREITYGLAENLGFTVSDSEYDATAGRTTKDSFALLQTWHDFPLPLEVIVAEYEQLYLDRLDAGIDGWAVPGAIPLIHSLKARGVRVGLASSASTKCIDRVLAALDLGRVLDTVVAAEHIEHPKPAPDCYRTAADRLGVAPAECVAIEDATNGLIAAHAAGMYCIGYRNPGSGVQDLGLADLVLDSFVGEDLASLFGV